MYWDFCRQNRDPPTSILLGQEPYYMLLREWDLSYGGGIIDNDPKYMGMRILLVQDDLYIGVQ